jgi:hypothetical protein
LFDHAPTGIGQTGVDAEDDHGTPLASAESNICSG